MLLLTPTPTPRPPLAGGASAEPASAARACASWRGPRGLVRERGRRRCGRRSGWCWCGTGRARGTRRGASRGAPTCPCSRPRASPRPRPPASCSSPTPSTPASPARSRRTAEIIWAGRDEDLIPDSDLREIDLYSFQGLLKHEGKERYGVLFGQWQKNAANFSIDGHYPVRELWDRAQSSWERILAHEGKSVLVVAHNAVNQALLATSLGLGTEYFRILLQSNCGASVLDFTPQTAGGPPSVCLNRLNQTPNPPVAAGSSGGRKTSKRIILACQGATQNSPEISLAGVGYGPLNMLGIIQSQKTAELLLDLKVNSVLCSPQVAAADTATTICEVQEAADCLGADCVPRYVEMKKLLELETDDAFQTKQKRFGEIVQSGWLGSMEYRNTRGIMDSIKGCMASLAK